MEIFGEISRSFQSLCEPCRVPASREESVPYLQRSHITAIAADAAVAREAELSTRGDAAHAVLEGWASTRGVAAHGSSTAVPCLARKAEGGQSPDTTPARQPLDKEQAKLEEEARLERLRQDMSLLVGGWRGSSADATPSPTPTWTGT